MSVVPRHFALTEPEAAREYLLTIAAALQDLASPGFRGNAAAVAAKSSLILVRIAQQLVPVDPELAQSLVGRGPAVEGELLDRLEAERSAFLDLIGAAQAARELDAASLEAYLRRHPPFRDETRLKIAVELPGGRAKRTVLIELDAPGDGPAELILRQDLPSAYPRTSVTFEYPLLQTLRGTGIKLPRPLLLEPIAGPLGGPFMLVEKLPGRTVGDLMSPPRSEPLALQLAEQLARLHTLPVEPFARLPDLGTKVYSQDQLRETLARYRDMYERFDAPSETISHVFAWLDKTIGAVEGPLAMLHGDVGFHNILVENGILTGILDWEEAHLGNPAEDIGYCRGDIEIMMDWPRFLGAYRDAGGPVLADLTLDFYALLGDLKVYSAAVITRAKLATGEMRDLGIAECIIDWGPRLRHRLSRRLRALLQSG